MCQFDRVDAAEIRDILYGMRFLQLARAATTALQLTPRADQLYLPLFRHFHKALQTLTLWTLGVTHSNATLCAESTSDPEMRNKSTKMQGGATCIMKQLSGALGIGDELQAPSTPLWRQASAGGRVPRGLRRRR